MSLVAERDTLCDQQIFARPVGKITDSLVTLSNYAQNLCEIFEIATKSSNPLSRSA